MNKLFQLYAVSGLLIIGVIGASENYQPNIGKIDKYITQLPSLLLPQESVSNLTKFNNWLCARKASTILSDIFNECKDIKKDVENLSNPQQIEVHNWSKRLWLAKEENPHMTIGYAENITVPERIDEQDKKVWQHAFGVTSGTVGKGAWVEMRLTPEQIKALPPMQYPKKIQAREGTGAPTMTVYFSRYYSPGKNKICQLRQSFVPALNETQTRSLCSVYDKQLEALMNTVQKS